MKKMYFGIGKGTLKTLIYYAVCGLIYFGLTIFLQAPRHSPGINHFFLFLLLIISFGLIIYNLIKVSQNRKENYYFQSLIIHVLFAIALISIYFIGYYRQFS